MKPNCEDGLNVCTMANGTKVCCDARKKDCPCLRLIDIGHVDVPVCIYEEEEND